MLSPVKQVSPANGDDLTTFVRTHISKCSVTDATTNGKILMDDVDTHYKSFDF